MFNWISVCFSKTNSCTFSILSHERYAVDVMFVRMFVCKRSSAFANYHALYYFEEVTSWLLVGGFVRPGQLLLAFSRLLPIWPLAFSFEDATGRKCFAVKYSSVVKKICSNFVVKAKHAVVIGICNCGSSLATQCSRCELESIPQTRPDPLG